jgi:hypothetical protein
MTIKQLVTHACTFALLAAPLACNSETQTGTLVVPFEIGAGIECSLKNVTEVKISLFDMPADGANSEEVDSLTVPCAEGEARFDNLPVDRYYITAEGKDAMDFTVVDNGGNSEPDIGEVLAGTETKAATVNMTSTPAQLWVRFELNKDNFQAMCSQIVIDNFKITAFKNGGADPLISTSITCDAVPDPDDSYHHIPDEMRDLDGSVFDYIRIQPLDKDGNMTGTDLKYPLVAAPGAGRTVKLTFSAECTADTCDLACNGGSCTPDA